MNKLSVFSDHFETLDLLVICDIIKFTSKKWFWWTEMSVIALCICMYTDRMMLKSLSQINFLGKYYNVSDVLDHIEKPK